jgi:hypothetical protein
MPDTLLFIFGRALAAAIMLPLALLFQVVALLVFAQVLGIGAHSDRTRLHRAFAAVEANPLALGIVMASIIVAAALVSAGLVS